MDDQLRGLIDCGYPAILNDWGWYAHVHQRVEVGRGRVINASARIFVRVGRRGVGFRRAHSGGYHCKGLTRTYYPARIHVCAVVAMQIDSLRSVATSDARPQVTQVDSSTMYTFADTKSVTAVKVVPADVPRTECTVIPSASPDVILTPDVLTPSDLKPCTAEKHMHDRYRSMFLPTYVCPLPRTSRSQTKTGYTTQTNPSTSSTLLVSKMYPSIGISFRSVVYSTSRRHPLRCMRRQKAFLNIISDLTHILTPSAYLEPENAYQSAGELKRYCTFLICRDSSPLITQSQSKSL